MKLKSICKKIEYTLLQGSMDIEVCDIAYDSRLLAKDSIFICIPGSLTDGHKYISDAISKGALAIVIEDEATIGRKNVGSIPQTITIIKVASARYALALISSALFGHPAQRLTTIGLTGTKGKTTTAYMIKSILDAAGKKSGLIGTIGTLIDDTLFPSQNTTPESYELHCAFAKMVDAGCEYAIVEVSSQGLKLERTAGIIFDYGIFTNLSPDHIGPMEHESMEEYIMCKSLLFRQCKIGIVNADDAHTAQILQAHTCRVKTFSILNAASEAISKSQNYPADLVATNIQFINVSGKLGVSFTTKWGRQQDAKGGISHNAKDGELHNAEVCGQYDSAVGACLKPKVYIPGKFTVYNALAAMLTCHLIGIADKQLLEGLEMAQVTGRVEMLPVPGDYTLIIDFAHNEVSTRSILETLLEYQPKRLICLYGCGGNRSRQRRYDMGEVTGQLADLCVLTCDNPRSESIRDINNDIKVGLARSNGSYIEIDDRKKAIAYCISNARPGDMIVLLGKGHENYQEINGFKYHFDEREAVAEALQNK